MLRAISRGLDVITLNGLAGAISLTSAGGSIVITPSGSTINLEAVSGTSGTVTSVSVVTANGFAGTVANATSTPEITLTTSITGVLKGNGTAISAATAGTDYSAGTAGLTTGILKSTTATGALTIAVAGDFPTLNQNTSGNAATVTVADAGGDTTTWVLLGTSQTGSLAPSTDAGLTYNSTTNALTADTFIGALTGNVTGNVSGTSGSSTGNAATATALATGRTIGGVNFDGTANIVPQTIQSINEATDTTCFPLFISASGSQSLQPLNNAGLIYNSNTNNLTATTFTGALSGNATTSTNTTGNAATVTTNANLTGPITSTGNATAVAAQTGTGSTFVMQASPTLTTAVLGSSTATTQTPGDNSTKVATTAYVDTAILGQDYKEACKYASVAALPSIVYANGSSGVGATLTGVALAAISLDSSSPAVNDRVLIKNQVSDFQNGIYTVTATGSGIAVFVLTRAIDFNQSYEINTGDTTFITAGSTLANTTWAYNGIDAPTMGTTSLTFVQTAGPGSYTAGNGISITGVSIAIDTAVTLDKNTAQVATNKDLSSGTNTFPATWLPLAGGTLTGLLTLKTGTNTVAPLKMVAGTNLSTPVAGTIEFDGTDFFITV